MAAVGAGVVVMVAVMVAGFGFATHVRDASQSTAVGFHERTRVSTPFAFTGVSPASGSTDVPSSVPLEVRFSTALAPDTPLPALSPPIPGHWVPSGPSSLEFIAGAPAVPGTNVTLTIPGGPSGMRSASGRPLAHTQVAALTVKPGSVLRLQEILAQLGYLPVTWTPIDAAPMDTARLAETQAGVFSWRWATTPAQLKALWQPGRENSITDGALMAFENAHGMATTTTIGPTLWAALLRALEAGQVDPYPYAYAMVTMSSPENLVLWVNGADVFTSLANTGIPVSPTATGTYPVYLRYRFQVMRGTNPNGSRYADPVSWVSYFNGGDAVHGFVRATYGWPQSLGCVELPPSNAAVVWPYMHIGTLVTVS
ncbi:MAG: L,D-transpeptidase family protein [Acidimicrobiales bacterium]